MARKLASVVLVGRPNVGKSTLFNRMIGSRRAIVAPIAGTTRDSLAFPVSWQGMSFQLSDTGGLYGASKDPLHELVVIQGQRAIAGADLLIFLVDGREGLVSGDQAIAEELRRTGLPLVLGVNKADDKRAQARLSEFYQLGIEPIMEISAEHGTGVAELLDEVGQRLKALGFNTDSNIRAEGRGQRAEDGVELDSEASDAQPPAPSQDAVIAIIGRPNVGKSSLLNR